MEHPVENIALFSGMNFSEFGAYAFYRQGWIVFGGERIIGSIALSDCNGSSVAIHLTVDKRCHGQWASPEMLEAVSDLLLRTFTCPKLVNRWLQYNLKGVSVFGSSSNPAGPETLMG